MADVPEEPEEPPKKRSKIPLILSLVLTCVGGGGGFYATWTGLIFSGESHQNHAKADKQDEGEANSDVTYIDVEPLTISLRAPSESQYLRFRASLEVKPENSDEVANLLPRVTDVLNSYLRAIEPAGLDDPSALARLRGQMLRRIQIITGLGKVNDLLIMEFVLN